MRGKQFWLISSGIPVLFYLIWIPTRLFDSEIQIILMFLWELLLMFMLVWTIFLLINIKKLRFQILPLLILTTIPYWDTIFNLRFHVEDMFKPKTLFIAKMTGPISGTELNLRINNTCDYLETSLTGTRKYKGEFAYKNDSIFCNFYEAIPLSSSQVAYWKILKNENKIELKINDSCAVTMDILKNELK